jgi:hypothetical protein
MVDNPLILHSLPLPQSGHAHPMAPSRSLPLSPAALVAASVTAALCRANQALSDLLLRRLRPNPTTVGPVAATTLP